MDNTRAFTDNCDDNPVYSLAKLAEMERDRLRSIAKTSENAVKQLPAGYVEVKKVNNNLQFYCRKDPKMKNGVYMPAADRERAYGIIQRRYLERIHRTANEQLKVLNRFLDKYDPNALAGVFLKETPGRQTIIEPLVLPDDIYASNWQAETFEHKGFADNATAHYTDKKERVRSKSEVIIANALHRAGIPYHYEKPLVVKNHVFHPDFTVLRISDRKEMFWEHLGMMDDKEYANSVIWKIREYEENGIYPGDRLIITAETYRLPFNLSIINRTINHYLKI